MLSDDFDATSARLLSELHGQLVAEHRRQVAAIGSSAQQHSHGPVKPESAEPSIPLNPPPQLENFMLGSTGSLDDLKFESVGDSKAGMRKTCSFEDDLLEDVDHESVDSHGSVSGAAHMPPMVLASSGTHDLTVLPCPLSKMDVRLLPHALDSNEDETPNNGQWHRSGTVGTNGTHGTPAKSCLSVKVQGDNPRASPRVSLMEAPEMIETFNDDKAVKGKRKSIANAGSKDLGGYKSPAGKDGKERLSCDYESQASNIHIFEVLEAWTLHGGKHRTRVFSVRTKSKLVSIEGAPVAVAIAMEEGQRSYRTMINPNSLNHLMWDLFGCLMIVYDIVMVPMEVFDLRQDFSMTFMDWLIRLYWTLHIPITFRTGFVRSDGSVEMRPRVVLKRYTTSWLPLDVVCVSVDWAEAVLPESTRLLRALRALRGLRTLRLLRFMKAPEISDFINDCIRSEQVVLSGTIFKSIVAVLGVTHLIACAWYAIGRFAEYGPGESTWIKKEGLQEEEVRQRYSWCLHWALSMMAGEHIVPPQNASERIFTICVLLLGIMVSASFVSVFTSTLTQLQMLRREESSRLTILRRYLFDQHISWQLAMRIQKNAQHALAQKKRFTPESSVVLLTMISNPLRVELHFEIHSTVLMEHPFFKCYNEVNKPGLRKVCHIGITMLSLSAGDVLFHDLEVPKLKQVFFVTSGGLDYKKEDKDMMTVAKPSWLCEAVLWTAWTHCGTARAISESRLMVLDGQVFQDSICSFPSEHARDYAEAFVDLLNAADASELTDLALGPEEQNFLTEMVFPEEDSSEEESSEEDSDSSGDDSEDELENTIDPTEMAGMSMQNHSSNSSNLPAMSSIRNSHVSVQASPRHSGQSEDNEVLGFPKGASTSSFEIKDRDHPGDFLYSRQSTLQSEHSRVSKVRRVSSVSRKRQSGRTSKKSHAPGLHHSKSRTRSIQAKRSLKLDMADSTVGFLERLRRTTVGSRFFGPPKKHNRSSARTSTSTSGPRHQSHRKGSLQTSLPLGVIPTACTADPEEAS